MGCGEGARGRASSAGTGPERRVALWGSDGGPGLRNDMDVIPIYPLLPADLLMARVVG